MNEKSLHYEILKNFSFVYNSCPKQKSCVKEIFIYDAHEVEQMSQEIRHTWNKGPSITTKELNILDAKVSSKVKCGQSLYHILQTDKSKHFSEQTVRMYIAKGFYNASMLNLPRTVQRKPSKKKKKEQEFPLKF